MSRAIRRISSWRVRSRLMPKRVAELLQRARLVGHQPLVEELPLAPLEPRAERHQHLVQALAELVLLGRRVGPRADRLDEIEPRATAVVVPSRDTGASSDASRSAEPLLHVDDLALGHAQRLGHAVRRRHEAHALELGLLLAQVEEELALRRVVPSRTMRAFCRMYRRMYARIHQAA